MRLIARGERKLGAYRGHPARNKPGLGTLHARLNAAFSILQASLDGLDLIGSSQSYGIQEAQAGMRPHQRLRQRLKPAKKGVVLAPSHDRHAVLVDQTGSKLNIGSGQRVPHRSITMSWCSYQVLARRCNAGMSEGRVCCRRLRNISANRWW